MRFRALLALILFAVAAPVAAIDNLIEVIPQAQIKVLATGADSIADAATITRGFHVGFDSVALSFSIQATVQAGDTLSYNVTCGNGNWLGTDGEYTSGSSGAVVNVPFTSFDAGTYLCNTPGDIEVTLAAAGGAITNVNVAIVLAGKP